MNEIVNSDNLSKRRWGSRHGGLVALIALSILLGAAMLGLLGGAKSPTMLVRAPTGSLAVKTPLILRNGLFFEQRIRISARQPITDAVVAITPGLWQDITVNSMIPAAADEEYKSGAYHFHYGPMQSGDVIELKIDGQINPPLTVGTNGAISWLDGDRQIASLPLHIKVLP